MLRRDLLKRTMLLGAAGLLPLPRLYAAPFAGYSGRLLVTVQCDGGWDVTSFCDPKTNQPGEKEITQWSKSGDIRTAGNIQYAPYANNQPFFENHYQDMLVINGIDMQTNSHTTGVLHNWSGRNSEGFPTITSMFAANNAPEQPLSYLNFGGFSQTANLIRFSRFQNINNLKVLLEPEVNVSDKDGVPIKRASEIERIREFRIKKTQEMLADPTLMNRQKNNLEAYSDALSNKVNLKEFKNFLPNSDELKGRINITKQTSSDLKDQVKMTAAAFESGLSSAADLYVSGYDTHTTHDALHKPLLAFTTDAIQLFWQLAEERGIADRITMVIGSDFGRTPHYNATEGKDHWPIGSTIVMEKNASWTNRSVGLTDEGHNAFSINPSTLERDDQNGTVIHPKHIHKALRRHLGIENSLVEQNLAFTNTEDFSFFT
jgi:hypothetical protein